MTSKTSERILKILELFGDEKFIWSVEEAAEVLELKVSTAYRYFKSLKDSGMLHKHSSGQYVLGPAIVQFDRQIRLHDPLISASREEMQYLAKEYGDNVIVLLARLYRDNVMCVHQEYSRQLPFQVGYDRGRLMPLDRGAASKVILANITPWSLKSIKKNTATYSTDAKLSPEQRVELREIREQGYCITVGEVDPGMKGLSVPIFRPNQTVEGSLSLVVSAERSEEDKLLSALTFSRKRIEAQLAINATIAGREW